MDKNAHFQPKNGRSSKGEFCGLEISSSFVLSNHNSRLSKLFLRTILRGPNFALSGDFSKQNVIIKKASKASGVAPRLVQNNFYIISRNSLQSK